jgi:hypothetical protein
MHYTRFIPIFFRMICLFVIMVYKSADLGLSLVIGERMSGKLRQGIWYAHETRLKLSPGL